jgi:putative heme-binding domain-containing protein
MALGWTLHRQGGDYLGSGYYREIEAPLDSCWILDAMIGDAGRTIAGVILTRPRGARPFTVDDVQRLDRLRPWLAHAFRRSNSPNAGQEDEAPISTAGAPVQGGQLILTADVKLVELKGHEVLIRAIPHVLDTFPQTRFAIVGPELNGAHHRRYAERLRRLPAELNLGVASAGVDGGIFAEIDFLLHDPNHDGRVRISEIAGEIEDELRFGDPAIAPLALFDVLGAKIAAPLVVLADHSDSPLGLFYFLINVLMLYVTDWVDGQHCHNPRPETWDRTNGRIYRISWAKTWHPVKVDLSKKNDGELAELLPHRNRWFANTARRVLQYRATQRRIDPAVVAEWRKEIGRGSDRRLALESLWALHVIAELTAPTTTAALAHADEAVRAYAVRLATESRDAGLVSAEQLRKLAAADNSPKVRLAIASAMPLLPAGERWEIGTALASHAEDTADRFVPAMIWYGLAPLVADDVSRAVAIAESTPLPVLKDSILWSIAKNSSGRDALVQRIQSLDGEEAARLLGLLNFSLQREASLPPPQRWKAIRDRFTGNDGKQVAPETRRMSEELSAVFGDEYVLKKTRGLLTNDQAPVEERRSALAILNRIGDREAVAIYPRLLENRALRAQVIPLLARSSDLAVAKGLLKSFVTFTLEEKAAALGALASRKEFALELLRAVDEKKFDRKELSALQIRQMHSLGDPELTKLLEKVWGKIGVSSEDARKLIAKIRKTYTTAPLWAYNDGRGQQIFQKTCATCHPLDGTTVPLGPGLKGSWRNGLDYFLENIVDPNAVVGENYRVTVIVTDSGQTMTGLLDSESETAVVLRTAEKTFSIPKKEIAERKLADESLMPTGLLDKMSEIEVIELLKFLLRSE